MLGFPSFEGPPFSRPLSSFNIHGNPGSLKLLDSRLLRKIRNTAVIGPLLSKVPIPAQDRIGKALGLRCKLNKDDTIRDTTVYGVTP